MTQHHATTMYLIKYVNHHSKDNKLPLVESLKLPKMLHFIGFIFFGGGTEGPSQGEYSIAPRPSDTLAPLP